MIDGPPPFGKLVVLYGYGTSFICRAASDGSLMWKHDNLAGAGMFHGALVHEF